jgi:Fe2+ or Zn2+ uptake regulation protein
MMSTYSEHQHQLVRELHFAEDWGMVFELLALPRMAGRVWAVLAMSEEPYLSADDLENRLEASSGAVNAALQFLTRQGVLERVRVPGQRRYYFGLRPGTMEILVGRRLAVMGEIRDLAARGVREFADRPAARARFAGVHEFYEWVDAQMAALIDRFRAERQGGKAARS